MKKRVISIVLACALAASVAAGCGSQDSKSSDTSSKASGSTKDSASPDTPNTDVEKTKITFVLDWTPNTNHTGLYVAEEKGYFSDAGLDVEIVQPPEDGAEVLVGSGKAQFGVSFQDSLLPYVAGENKLPIASVAALVQHNTSGIISLKGKGMDKPKGMEGKKYAT